MLQNLLTTCGLNTSEQIVLLHLLKRGQTTASLIAKATGLKRPSVYAILENLIIANLVIKQKRDKVNYFAAVEPRLIPDILKRRAEVRFADIQSAASLLTEPLQALAQEAAHDFGSFHVSTYESITACYKELENALLGGDFSAILNPQTVLTEEGTRVVKHFLKTTAKTKAHIREIAVAGPKAEFYKTLIQNPNHEFREISADKAIISDIILVNGSVVVLEYGRNESVLKIKQPQFFQSMMTVFEMLWDQL